MSRMYRARLITMYQFLHGNEDSYWQDWLESSDLRTVYDAAKRSLKMTECRSLMNADDGDDTIYKAAFFDITDEDHPVHLFDLQRITHNYHLIMIRNCKIYPLEA